jgi:hypothetical protein
MFPIGLVAIVLILAISYRSLLSCRSKNMCKRKKSRLPRSPTL